METSSLDGTNVRCGLQWRRSLFLTFPRRGDFSASPGHDAGLVLELCTATQHWGGVKSLLVAWVSRQVLGPMMMLSSTPLSEHPTGIHGPPEEAHTRKTCPDLLHCCHLKVIMGQDLWDVACPK